MMSNAPDPNATATECTAALSSIRDLRGLPERLERLSERWLGRPYLAFTLVGGPDTAEQLVTRLDGFDCVTFAESE